MRVNDRAAPAPAPPDHVPMWEAAKHLVLALERLPAAAYTWDDEDPAVVWDDPNPDRYVWDAPSVGGGMTDVVCDFVGLELSAGHPDDDGLVESSSAVLTVQNADGRYSQLDASGRVVYAALGRRLEVLGRDAGGTLWWLFGGRVTSWAENADATVTITAHDGFSRLAAEVTPWTPGTADQTTAARIGAILTRYQYTDPTRLAVTDVRMGAPVTDRSPLEEMQVTALSDGGVLYCDADGTLVYAGRDFYVGRTDQVTVRTVSDNVCDALPVWDLTYVADDAGVASRVELANYATPPLTAAASSAPGPWDVPLVRTHPESDLWTYQTDGNRLATDLLARWSNDAARFELAVYPLAPHHDYWPLVLDCRLGDRLNVIREVPAVGGVGVLNVDALVLGIAHDITPEEWVTTLETGRVTAWRQSVLWDASPFTWDDPDPRNVWSY